MDRSVVRLLCAVVLMAGRVEAQPSKDWPIHAKDRPQPAVVDPGIGNLPVPAPSDAIVLFDGKDLAKWVHRNGNAPAWVVRDGYFEVKPGSGDLLTLDGFGDVQLHVEWATPAAVRGSGQERGNSGVYLMDTYELQVLDSYNNETYPDGQAGAIYGQFPPLVNASRPPGGWQSYDVTFRGPRFDSSGRLLRPATMTVLHNGIEVQNQVTLSGPTGHYTRPPYAAHPDKLPILLQDHGDPVRYRNIWLTTIKPDNRD